MTHSTEKEEAFNWNRRCFQYLWGVRYVCAREKWVYLGANQRNRPIPGQTVQRGIWDVEIQPVLICISLAAPIGTSGTLCPGNWQPKVMSCVRVCVRWKCGWEVDRPCRLVFFVVCCYNWDFWSVHACLWASLRGRCAIELLVWQLDNTMSAVCHSRSALPQDAWLREHAMWRRRRDPWHEDQ